MKPSRRLHGTTGVVEAATATAAVAAVGVVATATVAAVAIAGSDLVVGAGRPRPSQLRIESQHRI